MKLNLKKIFNTKGTVDEENGIFLEQFLGLGYRKISDILIEKISKTKITPNQITIARSLIFLPLIFYFFQRGTYICNIIGFVLAMLNCFFDVLDGQFARATSRTSALGAWLDEISDRLTTYLVFVAIIIGSYQHTLEPKILVAGVFVLFFHGMLTIVAEKYQIIFGGGGAFFALKIKEIILTSPNARFWDKIYLNLYGFYSWPSYLFFAVRYQILFGIIFNILPYMLYYWVVAFGFRIIFLCLLFYRVVDKKESKVFFIAELKKIYQSNNH